MANDIEIQTGGLREFGYSGPELDYSSVMGSLGSQPCTGLPCATFRTAVQDATQAVMKALTEYQQGLNALKTGAVAMADIYENGEYQVANTIASVVQTPAGLPDVNGDLQDAANRPLPPA